jgi:hypothetical protein
MNARTIAPQVPRNYTRLQLRSELRISVELALIIRLDPRAELP